MRRPGMANHELMLVNDELLVSDSSSGQFITVSETFDRGAEVESLNVHAFVDQPPSGFSVAVTGQYRFGPNAAWTDFASTLLTTGSGSANKITAYTATTDFGREIRFVLKLTGTSNLDSARVSVSVMLHMHT